MCDIASSYTFGKNCMNGVNTMHAFSTNKKDYTSQLRHLLRPRVKMGDVLNARGSKPSSVISQAPLP